MTHCSSATNRHGRRYSYGNSSLLWRVTVDMRQHCTDGSFRFCRRRAHTEALSEDSGPEALSTPGQYFALHVFYAILQQIAGELSATCCRTITMTRYTEGLFAYELAISRCAPAHTPRGCGN